jgi:adenosylmethionine-8-amino-7-oxononanoate aminotransferase
VQFEEKNTRVAMNDSTTQTLKHNNALHQWHPMAHPKSMQTSKPDIIARGEGVYI